MSKQSFGKLPEGQEVDLYTLKSEKLEVQISSYGAAIIELRTPDRSGRWEDIIIGPQDLASHVANQRSKEPIFFGVTVGRYANRIAHGKFSLDGKTYTLPKNDGENSLHGGPGGFHNVVWESEPITNGVAFHYLSKDGEQGYPGNLSVTVRYTVVGADLKIAYQATTDKPTVLNLTNHAYFNMAGAGRGTVLAHQLKLFASRFTRGDAHLMPTGEIRSVTGTPLDFRKSTTVGDRINSEDELIRLAHGYDHNFVIDEQGDKLKQAADERAAHWACDGGLDHRARDPVLHRQFSGWQLQGEEQSRLRQTGSILPGNAALPRFSQSPTISLDRVAPRTILPIANDLPFFRSVTKEKSNPRGTQYVLNTKLVLWESTSLSASCFGAISEQSQQGASSV